MSVRACQLAGLFRQRLLVTSAVHRAHVPGAPAAASGVCRTRLRRTPKLLRETAGCRLLSTDGATFGRSGVAARASRASEASTSGGEDAPEPDAVGGRPSAPATGAPAAPLSASDESSVEGDSDDKQEGSGGEEGGPRRPGKPAAPEKRILKVPTPRGMKELLMVGNVIVEPSLAEMIEPAENQRVTQSEYVQSCVSLAQCPPPKFPEFAFIGRSNVGKSSIINLITNRKQLAMVSKTPGARRAPQAVWQAEPPRDASPPLPLFLQRWEAVPSAPFTAVDGFRSCGPSLALLRGTAFKMPAATHRPAAGKTQTINHFKVVSGSSGPWYLVDLPGYGFAKAPGERGRHTCPLAVQLRLAHCTPGAHSAASWILLCSPHRGHDEAVGEVHPGVLPQARVARQRHAPGCAPSALSALGRSAATHLAARHAV